MSASGGRSINRRTFLQYAGVGLGAGGLLAACSPTGGQGGQAAPSAQNQRKITFLFDVTPYGKHGLFYAALDKGFWRENGLDVTIQSGQGSGDNVTKIGAKAAEFGFADTGALILGRAKGAAVKEVAMVHYKNLMMIVALKKFGINTPKDLEGKTFASTAADAGRVLLPVWGKIAGFDDTRVNIITTDQAAKPGSMVAGQTQGALDYYTAFPAYASTARQQGEDVNAIMYADYGLDIYNNGIITHEDTLRSDPDLVRRFLDGMVKGVIYAVEHPDEATDITSKYNPALSKETARAQLQIAIDDVMVDEVRRNGVGPMSADKMQFTLDTIANAFPLDRAVTVDEIYTNDFVPKGQLPKA